MFVLVAVKTCSSFGPPNKGVFLKELGHHLIPVTVNENFHKYLLRKISVAVQLRNASSVLGSLPWASKMEDVQI